MKSPSRAECLMYVLCKILEHIFQFICKVLTFLFQLVFIPLLFSRVVVITNIVIYFCRHSIAIELIARTACVYEQFQNVGIKAKRERGKKNEK